MTEEVIDTKEDYYMQHESYTADNSQRILLRE